MKFDEWMFFKSRISSVCPVSVTFQMKMKVRTRRILLVISIGRCCLCLHPHPPPTPQEKNEDTKWTLRSVDKKNVYNILYDSTNVDDFIGKLWNASSLGTVVFPFYAADATWDGCQVDMWEIPGGVLSVLHGTFSEFVKPGTKEDTWF